MRNSKNYKIYFVIAAILIALLISDRFMKPPVVAYLMYAYYSLVYDSQISIGTKPIELPSKWFVTQKKPSGVVITKLPDFGQESFAPVLVFRE